MKKILFITCNFPPVKGGISRFIYNIVNNLPSHRTHVIALPIEVDDNFDGNQNFDITRLKTPSAWNASSPYFKFLAFSYLKSMKKFSKLSLVVCDCAAPTLLLAAWIHKLITGTPYAVFVHGTDFLRQQKKRTIGRIFFNFLIENSNRIIANSNTTKSILFSANISTNIEVIHPPINIDEYSVKIPYIELRTKLGLNGKKIILTVARLVRRKGIDTIISTLPYIIQKIPNVHYLIVGNGPDLNRLKELAMIHGVEKHTTFVGFIPDSELASYYNICDLFVMVSRLRESEGDYEGFGIVYLEAGLFSKPVIAGNTGGVVDAVLQNKTGRLVGFDMQNTQVAKEIVELLLNKSLSEQLGKYSKERILNEFSLNKTIAKFITYVS